jgi:phage terminase large subunit-like protein
MARCALVGCNVSNPAQGWWLGNAVCKADRRGNLYPAKSRPDRKADATSALMMSDGRAMSEAVELPANPFRPTRVAKQQVRR